MKKITPSFRGWVWIGLIAFSLFVWYQIITLAIFLLS